MILVIEKNVARMDPCQICCHCHGPFKPLHVVRASKESRAKRGRERHSRVIPGVAADMRTLAVDDRPEPGVMYV